VVYNLHQGKRRRTGCRAGPRTRCADRREGRPPRTAWWCGWPRRRRAGSSWVSRSAAWGGPSGGCTAPGAASRSWCGSEGAPPSGPTVGCGKE